MKAKVKQILTSILYLLVLATVTGCVQEFEYEHPNPGAGDEVQVSFHIETSAATTVPTRAVQTTAETLIRNFVVVAFDKDDKFAYYKSVAVANPAAPATDFTVGVIKSATDDDKYSFVVLANIDDVTLQQVSDIEKGAKTKTELLESLYYENAALMGAGTYLPMSSPSTASVKVVEGLKFNGGNAANQQPKISLVRITARVDMKIASAITGKYRIKTVMLYDYNDAGSLWHPGLNTSTTITTPAVPAEAEIADTPLSVSLVQGAAEFTSGLYMFESRVADKTCLVVGLETSTDGGSTWVDTDSDGKPDVQYYKVLFARKDAGNNNTTTPFDVVRNRRYEFSITGVNGNGFVDPDDAYDSVIAGMDVDVIDWDEANMNVVLTDGIHILSVSPGELTIPKDGAAENDGFSLLIATDFEVENGRNWWAEVYADEAGTIELTGVQKWLTLDITQDNKVYTKENQLKSTVKLSADPNPGDDREAWIHIHTRVLNFKVKVTQLDSNPTYVWVTDLEGNPISALSFASRNLETKQFLVTWSPKTQPLQIERVHGAQAFDYEDDDETIYWSEIPASKNGSYIFTINPKAFTDDQLQENPFTATATTMRFIIGDGSGQVSEASINLRQMDYKLILNGFSDGYVGYEVNADVRSNARWKMEVVSGDELLQSPAEQLGLASPNGGNFTYKYREEGGQGPVKFRFSSPDGLFDPQEVTVNLMPISYMFAKSNIVFKDGKLTFAESIEDNVNKNIPANAQGVFFKWGSLVAISTPCTGDGYDNSPFVAATDVVFNPNPAGITIDSYRGVPWRNVSYPGYWEKKVDLHIQEYPRDYSRPGYNGGYDELEGLGDICRYISDKGWVEGRWRIPTGYEYYDVLQNETPDRESSDKGVVYGLYNYPETTSRDGLTPITSGILVGVGVDYNIDMQGDGQNIAPNQEDKIYFPASGEIDNISYQDRGMSRNVGRYGYYHYSCYPKGAAMVGNNSFGEAQGGSIDSGAAHTIRCIRDGIYNP